MALKGLFRKLAPYADDIAKGVANYGDDAARLVANYGDDAARAVANYGDDALRAADKVDDFLPTSGVWQRVNDSVDEVIPAFEDPSFGFGEVLPYNRQSAPQYWENIAYASGTTVNPKRSTINVRGKDIHYPMTDDAAGKTKLDKLWNVLNPDEEFLYGPYFGPEYSVESVARGEDVPGFPVLTRAVRDFEDYGLDDVFGGDVAAARDAHKRYRNSLQSRLNLAASIPKGYVPIDELHDTDFRPHLNTAEYRHSPLSQMFTDLGKRRYPNFDPELPF